MRVVLLVALVLAAPATAHAAILGVEARDIAATAGQQFGGVVATFEDDQVPSADDFTATIAWGDGTESAGSINCTDCGPNDPPPYVFEVRGTHTYGSAGDRTLTVTVDNPADQQEPVSDTATAKVAAPPQDPPPQTQPQPPPPQEVPKAPPPSPPTAKLSHVGPPPKAGGMLSFSAAGSTAASGKKIVAHLWDLNGDGDFEANTGTRPTATYLAGGTGRYDVKLAVIDSSGLRGETGMTVEVNSAVTGCENALDVGKVRLRASCIKKPDGGAGARAAQSGTLYEVKGVIDFNGLEISAPGKLLYDFEKGTITGDAGLSVRLKNTPIGDVIIYRKAGKVIWQLPVKGSIPTGKELRLITIGAGDGCTAGERAYCAKLPGNFPMTGTIDVSLTSSAEMKLAVNASLSKPFAVTGAVALRMVPKEGLKLDSLRFEMANAEFGVFKLELLRFVYEGPGTGDPFHEGELWEVAVAVKIPTTPAAAGVKGELRFVGGEFDYGRAVLTIPGGVPVGPGILLNHFEGEFGLTPTRIGGGLGVSLAAVAQVNGRFVYQSGKGVAQLHADGDFSLLGQQLATAYFDYFSTGYVGFGGELNYRWPQSSPLLYVNGKVGAWFESSRFQAEGDVQVRVWKINARVRAIANNSWLAACAGIKFIFTVEGYAALNLRTGSLDLGLGCNMGGWRIAPLTGPPARAAQAGVTTLRVGEGETALGIELTGRGGSPVVTLVGPRGERYTTPASPEGGVGEQGRWVASQASELARTLVRIEKPSPGVWRIEPEPGSPPIASMRTQGELPDPRVRVRLSGTGARRSLRTTMVPAPGRRLRLVERGSTSLQQVCVVARAAQTCPFRPEPGSRARRIEAIVEQDGMARQTLTVARFTAPSGRPGKPSRVRIVRRGSRAVASWRGVRGAGGYRVLVTSNDGRRVLELPRRPRLVVRDLVPQDTVRVRVQAVAGSARLAGPAATGRLGAVKPRRRAG